MIIAKYIYNHRGLKIHQSVESTKSYFDSDLLDHNHLTIYTQLKLDYPLFLKITKIKADDEIKIPRGIFGYYFINNSDTYFIYTSKNISLKLLEADKEIQTVIEERKQSLDFFVGLQVTDFLDDLGPTPIYNNSDLTEEQNALLSVQSTTLVGMGRQKMPDYLIGPIPVPMSEYCFLAFAFQRQAPNSDDPRITSGGRPTLITIILDHIDQVDKELMVFLELFLKHWTKTSIANQEEYSQEDLEGLYDDVHETIFLAKDLIMMRSIEQDELKHLFRQNFTENIILQSENEDLKSQLQKATGKKYKRTSSKKPSKKISKSTKRKKKKTGKKKTKK